MYLADLCSNAPPAVKSPTILDLSSRDTKTPDERPGITLDVKRPDGSTRQENFYIGPTLGKGAYALCIEVTSSKTNCVYACKVYNRSKLITPVSKSRVLTELCIHQNLHHQHIVKFFFWGFNAENIYFVLEKCNNNSLRHLLSIRKTLTECEARYFLHQLLLAVDFLHQRKICHRDLKLDNIFLHNMTVKLGDFGFSILLKNGKTAKTFCGTPNYIAPEVLESLEYSLPVDIWAIGIILYTMLYGKAPFEMKSTKETYLKIKNNKYCFPSKISVSEEAKDLIKSCLDPNPAMRPVCSEVLAHSFFTKFNVPRMIHPLDATQTNKVNRARKPLTEIANVHLTSRNCTSGESLLRKKMAPGPDKCMPKQVPFPSVKRPLADESSSVRHAVTSVLWDQALHERNIRRIYNRIQKIIFAKPSSDATLPHEQLKGEPNNADILSKHAYLGHHWIVKWVDYSQKFGIGYQLCNGTKGIKFNDQTAIASHLGTHKTVYTKVVNQAPPFESSSKLMVREVFCADQDRQFEYTDQVKERTHLLACFSSYMSNLPCSSGLEIHCKAPDGTEGSEVSLLGWTKSMQAVCFILTNYTVQVNFFDHMKIVLSLPDLKKDPFGIELITLVQEKGTMHSHSIDGFVQRGLVTPTIAKKLYVVSELLMQYSDEAAG